MASAAFKTCLHPGCPALVKGGSRCPKHAERHRVRQQSERNDDEVSKWYRNAPWARFRRWFLRANPQCQRIIDGVRCERVATLIHHRKSPRQFPELFLVAENCVALCAEHHHAHEGDLGTEVYADTVT